MQVQGFVNPPSSTSNPDGSSPVQLMGKQADGIVSELHGKHYTANYRGKLFAALAAAVTVPLTSSGVASVFTLYNPPGSGVNAEIVETSVAQVLSATLVDVVGWYYSTAAQTAAGTFTTKGTVQSLVAGNAPGNAVQFFSAYTTSGTQTLLDIIGSFGAITNATAYTPTKFYDGRLILPPGIAMHLMASTAAGTASGLTLSASWAEWPI
jgi:hypothetical protein